MSNEWDLFISHASEDKDFVKPLEEKLTNAGFKVWYDEHILTLGDSLVQKINEGLAKSKFGIVILSPNFFAKNWPQLELDGLFSFETAGEKKILPIWHNIEAESIRRFSPLLAGKLAVKSNLGLDAVINEIGRVHSPGQKRSKNVFGFTDEFTADPVSVSLNLELYDSGTTVDGIDWHPTLKLLLELLPVVRKDIANYRSESNYFSNLQPDIVKDYLDSLSVTEKTIHKTKLGVEKRFNYLLKDFDAKWDYDRQKCIVNFLGFSSIHLFHSLFYAIPVSYFENKVSLDFLKRINKTSMETHVNNLFNFTETPFSARFESVSNLVFESYQNFSAKKSDLLEAEAIYPSDVHPSWYYSVLIPQVEFFLARANPEFRLRYTPPTAKIVLVKDERGLDYIPTSDENLWLSALRDRNRD